MSGYNATMDITVHNFTLTNLSGLNVIIGKNGCGKSYILKEFEQGLQGRDGYGLIRYISPERGGLLNYEAGIEQAILQNPQWIGNQRRQNQSTNFRQQSATLFRRLELLVLREIETEHVKKGYVPKNFSETFNKLNRLLDRVYLERDNAKAFKVLDREARTDVGVEQLSSGESELISLGVELLFFVKECQVDRNNVLLIDEPDGHLHPDLQDRLARFIVDALADQPKLSITIILATHSTAFVSALADKGETRIAFMQRKNVTLDFKLIGDVGRTILPIFGAHPLSNVFNEAPVFLIEGEDDERIWQQAIRSSNGKIRVHPCVVEGAAMFAKFEREVNTVIGAVYDDAKAFSLRDRDHDPELINDEGYVVRMRLSCRAAENMMLTDEVLVSAGTTWVAMQEKVRQWVTSNPQHQYCAEVQSFVDLGFERKGHDLKRIRNILVGLFSDKPWEVLVGKAIAELTRRRAVIGDGTLRDFMGAKLSELCPSGELVTSE